jgi:hypothetical protein
MEDIWMRMATGFRLNTMEREDLDTTKEFVSKELYSFLFWLPLLFVLVENADEEDAKEDNNKELNCRTSRLNLRLFWFLTSNNNCNNNNIFNKILNNNKSDSSLEMANT